MPRRLVRLAVRCARALGWLALTLALVTLALLAMLQTAPGRRAILRLAVPLINARLAGHVAVGGIGGDLWHGLVLVEARLDDAEGVEAAYVRRLEARIDWRAALHGRLHLRDLAIDGARLTLRHLRDNRLNVVALPKPSARSQGPRRPHEPPTVDIDHFHLALDGAYHPPRGHEQSPLNWPRGRFDIEGALHAAGGEVRLRVDRFVSDSQDPLQAHVELRGGLRVTPHATRTGATEFTLEDIDVTVASDGDQIARLHPALHPRGPWQLHAAGGGPLSELQAHGVLSAPAGSITVDGSLGRTFPGIRWRASVVGDGLDPAAGWRGPPPGRIDFSVEGSGDRGRGEILVERLVATADGIALFARGRSDFGGHGEGELRASIDRLGRLAGLGIRPAGVDAVDGRLRLDARMSQSDGAPRIRVALRADGLWLQQKSRWARVATLSAAGSLAPARPMTLRFDARGVELGQEASGQQPRSTLSIVSASLTARGRPRRFAATLAARLGDGSHGQARLRALVGTKTATLHLEALELTGRSWHFRLPEPARLALSGTRVEPRLAAALAGVSVTARLHLGDGARRADVDVAAADLARVGRALGMPLAGSARAHGHVDWQRRLRLDAEVAADSVRVAEVAVDRLRAGVHSVDLAGELRVRSERIRIGSVPISMLMLVAQGSPERLHVTFEGTRPDRDHGTTRLYLDLAGPWHTRGLSVVDAEMTLRALDLDLPRHSWRLLAPAALSMRHGQLALQGLSLSSGDGKVWLDGSLGRGTVDATLRLSEAELEELSRVVGHPDLFPRARWSGRVHIAGTPAAPLVDAALEARAEEIVAWYGLAFQSLSLRAFADGQRARLHLEARGLRDARLIVDTHGELRRSDGRPVALMATLDRLQLSVQGRTWQLRQPCAVEVGARLRVADCRLGSGRAEIALAGAGPLAPRGADRSLDVSLTTHHLNLRDLSALLEPGHPVPPHTDFDIAAHLVGTREAPLLDVALSGRAWEIDEGGLPENVNYRVTAHYEAHRVRGAASMRQVGSRLGVGANFDLPTKLDGEEPIALALEARPVPFFKVRQLLPTRLANLGGFFVLHARAAGTTRHPRLSLQLHAAWELDHLRHNNTVIDVAYDGRELVVNSRTSLDALDLIGSLLHLHPLHDAGRISVDLHAPVDLVAFLRAPRQAMNAFAHDAPISASIELRNVDLRKVPMQTIGLAPPLTAGRVQAALHLGGTLYQPSLHGSWHAVDLAHEGVIDHLDLDGALAWEAGRVQLSGKAALRGASLLTYRGQAMLDGRALVDSARLRDGSLAIDVELPAYPLRRLRAMQPRLHAIDGTLRGRAEVRGSFSAPDLRMLVHAEGLGLGPARFATVDGQVRLWDGRWHFDIDADEAGGGELHVDGSLSRDRALPLRLGIDARALDIRFLSALSSQIGELQGRLDARLRVDGTLAAPRPNGWATLTRGSFNLRHDPRRYEGLLALRIGGGEAILTRLWLRGGEGTLEASGSARLDGIVPTQMTLQARAHRFELTYGAARARLDADFVLEGDRADQGFRGELRLTRGSIQLPDLRGFADAVPVVPLADVRFADLRAQSAQAARRAGQGGFIVARIDGPLSLRSNEVDLDLAGALGVTVAGRVVGVDGVVEASRGTMVLLGHSYVVERAMFAFAGAPDDPALHLRVSRPLGNATVAIVVEGTARRPVVHLTCEPPIYDRAQLESLILAGRRRSDRFVIKDLSGHVAGLLSELIIRKIRERLAPGSDTDLAEPFEQLSYASVPQSPLYLGRFISDRIYLRYEHNFSARVGRAAASASEASAQYRLGKGFEVDTTFGDAGVGGVYFLWTTKH